MKKILFGIIFVAGLNVNLNAEDKLISSMEKKTIQSEPATSRKKPIRPIVRPNNLYGVHHHTYYETIVDSNCDQYIKIIKEKDAKIEALLKENARLKDQAQANLQKRLKKEYDKEMQKFENRRN